MLQSCLTWVEHRRKGWIADLQHPFSNSVLPTSCHLPPGECRESLVERMAQICVSPSRISLTLIDSPLLFLSWRGFGVCIAHIDCSAYFLGGPTVICNDAKCARQTLQTTSVVLRFTHTCFCTTKICPCVRRCCFSHPWQFLRVFFFSHESLRHAETHNTWEREAANLPTA